VLSAHRLLRSPVLGPGGQYLGHVFDLAVRCRQGRYPLMTGIQVCIGHYETVLPASAVTVPQPDLVHVSAAPDIFDSLPVHGKTASSPPGDRESSFLLRSELLGRWVV